jgi:hypothetical protein
LDLTPAERRAIKRALAAVEQLEPEEEEAAAADEAAEEVVAEAESEEVGLELGPAVGKSPYELERERKIRANEEVILSSA